MEPHAGPARRVIDGRAVTIEIDADLCVAIYDAQIGAGRLVRRDLLESAVAAPFAGFGGCEAYPTLIEKAARLAYGIAEAQPVMCQAGNLVRCGDCTQVTPSWAAAGTYCLPYLDKVCQRILPR